MAPSSDWDEIKRLAADFQKAQLSSTSQRLSERNCIEIVTKLIELKLVDVIFTTDGKEYLTPQELIKEIKDELYVRGGRVNTVDLAKELSVDLNLINTNLNEILKGKDVQLLAGYLITNYYLEKVAGEINEKLQQQGKITVGELSLLYDLPAEFIQHNILEKYIGKIIIGKQDSSEPRTFYTEEYITRTKAKIRGALMGLLRPTQIGFIISQCNVAERLFITLFDQLNAPGVLTGRHSGAIYVPSCYTKSQNDWVISFWRQNNYLEYDAITRLGISDPKVYVKKVITNEDDLTFLSSCVIGSQIKQQMEVALEECISSKSFMDVVSLLPSIFSETDIENMLDILLKNNTKSTINTYIDSLRQACMPITQSKVEEIVKSGKYQQHFMEKQISKNDMSQQGHVDYKTERREERRRKATSGKGGGGTQGRETKTKAVKKHPRSKQTHESESDDDTTTTKKSQMQLEIILVEDVENVIKDTLENEGLEDLVTPIAEYLHGTLNQIALTMAKDMAEKLLQNSHQNKKQSHSAAQDRINVLINDIKLYEKGLKLFPVDQQGAFIKYLLKSFGADVLGEFCKYAANQCNISVQVDTLSIEQRNKIINDLPEEYMKPLRALNVSLSEQNLDLFYQAVDLCLSKCDMILKKVDKKKDNCDDPALVLHLAILAIFTILNQSMLHASGRQVISIINLLKGQLKEEHFSKLQDYH
ncbi:unnamed protein product, partial [Leptidea sinapis]